MDETPTDTTERATQKLSPIIKIQRVNYNERTLNEAYSFQKFKSDNVFFSGLNYVKKYYKPSKSCCSSYIQKRLPIITWVKNYDIKANLIKGMFTYERK
jgi:hypothetical protein